MALKLVASISMKIPGSVDYSSVQASCSIEGEASDINHAPDEIRRLYDIAERAVGAQLGLTSSAPPATASVQPQSSNTPPVAHPVGARPSGRRAPAPISPAQARYLGQLLDRNPGALAQILADHRINGIGEMTSRDASAVIDRLKAVTA